MVVAVRKQIETVFATKGEALAFELHTMKEVDDKPWLVEKPDNRQLPILIDLCFEYHGKNIKKIRIPKKALTFLTHEQITHRLDFVSKAYNGEEVLRRF